ncbi:MAG: hypothetical protein ABSE74_05025, partial [Methanoregula sp.]
MKVSASSLIQVCRYPEFFHIRVFLPTVLVDEPVGAIAPEIYGHFVENLGGVVYDGVWVGEGSTIPNVNGVRKALVEALARVKPGVVRWPGGCFADQYDWRDGTGPRDKRPTRTNFWVDAAEWPKAARKD